MENAEELFWNASLEELKKGYIFNQDTGEYLCLICAQSFIQGYIYKQDDELMDACRAVEYHIALQHGSMFAYFLEMDKKYTGLTDNQKQLLDSFYRGYSDREIALQMGVGSTSTIRNQRFKLKEREKQSRVFLAIMELLAERAAQADQFAHMPKSSRLSDDRVTIKEEDKQKMLNKYFKQGTDGPLEIFPTREKRRLLILEHIIKRFNREKTYGEKEVNAILAEVYHDYVLLRRCLIDYGFMDRYDDGSAYWVRCEEKGTDIMDKQKRSELKKKYKDTVRPTGIYQVKNHVNGKVLIGSSSNLEGKLYIIQKELENGNYPNRTLQDDWNNFGKDNFSFDILDYLDTSEIDREKISQELSILLEMWLEKLHPYTPEGYNHRVKK